MKKNYIFISVKAGIIHKILINDIMYIKAEGDYVSLFITNKKYLLPTSLGRIINFLPKDIFIRCHRSFIVNVDRIDCIEGNSIYVAGNMILLGEYYKNNFLEQINFIKPRSKGII